MRVCTCECVSVCVCECLGVCVSGVCVYVSVCVCEKLIVSNSRLAVFPDQEAFDMHTSIAFQVGVLTLQPVLVWQG